MRPIALMLCSLAVAASAAAEVSRPADVATRARGAGRVVVARVLDVQAQYETNRFGDRLIVSHAVLEVLETLKGSPDAIVNLAIEGGTVGELTLRVSDLPSLREGEKAVFFLDVATTAGEHVPHRRGNGIMKLDESDRVKDSALSLGEVRRQVAGALAQGRGGR